MPVRAQTSEQQLSGSLRELRDEIEKLKLGVYAQTPAFTEIRIGNIRIYVEKGGGSTRGLVLKAQNTDTTTTAVLAVLR